jgi:isoleucyl-tRNA synthetase
MGEKKSFKSTLNLPKTEFSIRANAKIKEPQILEQWKKNDLYKKACEKGEGEKEVFTLHDGPPFANGHMHMGHALNRTLKDIVCKVKRMSGFHVISVPGWDCHGLPTELKVLKEFNLDKTSKDFDRVAFKKKCREYAQKWIDIQKEEIIRTGVITDWDNPYITMSPQYEAGILKSFATFVEKGYVQRKEKTVPWCASCQSVLAIAEIEYRDRKDPSCYILFPLEEKIEGFNSSLLVWTTTPWTIPLNRAVVLHPTAPYVLLEGKEENQAFIVGEQLADSICETVGIEKKVIKKLSPDFFKDKKVNHPYIKDLKVPIILDDMVLLEEGTACVHSAPGCGPEDYLLAIKNGLEIFSPISADGKYTAGIEPVELEGMPVSDGQIWSIKKMAELKKLFHKGSMRHSYPHCWRCHNSLIFRATKQWFCNLKHKNLIDNAIQVAADLKFVPEWGKSRLTASMASRAEWCLSRQNQWGVPIPAVICDECENSHLSGEFIRGVAKEVAREGVEFWDRVTIEELEKIGLLKDLSCQKCDSRKLSKEMNIVDVWFESGISHTAVQEQHPELQIPASVYLEGSDQHRGWFQSSLLSAMIMHNKTCTKTFVTHAYVLDEHAEKMSKSKGNVVSPQDLIERYSADILRLWVAASDFKDDILVAETSFKNVAEVYRKIRNTCRFMISNLYDFDFEKDSIALINLPLLDKLALAKLQDVIEIVKKSYDEYSFTTVFRTLNEYCTNDLSSFYLDVLKDRLYTEKSDGHLRRSAQTSMCHILDSLTRLIAPILSFLAEEVSDFYQKEKSESIHLQEFPTAVDIWKMIQEKTLTHSESFMKVYLTKGTAQQVSFPAMMAGWLNLLERIRPELLKAIEGQREKSVIKHSLESKVTIFVDENEAPPPTDDEAKAFLAFIEFLKSEETDVIRFFKDFIIVSQFAIAESKNNLNQSGLEWLYIGVEHADGKKCPRCWQWDVTDHPDDLCGRCVGVV